MAVDIETIGVGFDTADLIRGKQALEAVDKAADEASKAVDKVERSGKNAGESARDAGKDFDYMEKEMAKVNSISGEITGKLKLLAGAYLGTQTIKAFIETADAMQGMESRLKNVIGKTGDYEGVLKDLYRVSQQNNVSIQDSATLYARLLPSVEKMGGDSRNAMLMTEGLSTALRVNKASTAEANSAMIQFSQAMASGVLRGEEFNSVNEASPQFLDALASALGVNKGELRKMAEEGKLTADVIGNEMPGMMRVLQSQTYDLKDTISDSMSDMKNDTMLMVSALDDATGATGFLGDAVQAGSGLIRQFTNVLNDNKGSADLAGKGFDIVAVAIRAVGSIAETVLIGFSEVSYFLTTIGRTAGAAAASIAAALSGNFGAVKAISNEVEADNKRAREDADKYQNALAGMTTKVLQSREALNQHGLSARENGEEMQRLKGHSGNTEGALNTLTAATKGSKTETDAHKKAVKEAADEQKRQGELLVELSGFSKDYAQKTGDLSALYAAGKISLETFVDQHGKLLEKQPLNVQASKDAAAALKIENEYVKAAWEERKKQTDEIFKHAEQLDKTTEKIKAETTAIGLTKEQLEDLKVARLDEEIRVAQAIVDKDALLPACTAETEAHKATLSALQDLADATKENLQAKAAAAAAEAWNKTSKSITDDLAKGMLDGTLKGKDLFKGMIDWTKDSFKNTTLQPMIADIMTPFMNLWKGVYEEISASIIKPIIENIWLPFVGWFKDGVSSIMEETIVPIVKNVWQTFLGWFTDGVSAIAGTEIKPLVSDVWQTFKGWFGSASSAIESDVISPVLSTGGVTSWLSTFTSGLSSVMSWFSTTFSSILSSVGSSIGSLINGVGSLFGGSGGSAGGGGGLSSLGSIASGIGSVFPAIGGALSSGAAAVSGWFGGVGIGASGGGAVLNAALAESAVAGGLGAAGAAGGLMSTLAAAAPYVAAVVAIVSLLSKKKGGPKVEGAYNSGGFAAIPGGGELNDQAAQLFNGIKSTYTGVTQTLGGTAGDLTGATFIGKDPKGTALTQFVLDAKLNGTEIFSRNNRTTGGNVEDVGRSDQALIAAATLASNQAVLRALQETDFGQAINAKFDAISAAADSATIERAIKEIVDYKKALDEANKPSVTAPAATTSTEMPVFGGSGNGILSGGTVTATVSSDVLTLYTRTAVAAEAAAAKLAALQTWVYEAADGNANRVRQAIYDAASNDDNTRNVIVGELQQLRAEASARRQEAERQAREIREQMQLSAQAIIMQINTAAGQNTRAITDAIQVAA